MNKYFENPTNLEELRKQYKGLLKKFHPDNVGGSEDATKEINSEYEKLFKSLKNVHASASSEGLHFDNDFNTKVDSELRAALNKIIHLDGINIEICGSWIWVTGNTYPVKDAIKAAGYRYSRSKAAWYWHAGEYHRSGKKSYSMGYIRLRHGSVSVDSQPCAAIG